MRRRVQLPGEVDVAATIKRFRVWGWDPAFRVDGAVAWRAWRTPAGPASVEYRPAGPSAVEVSAWGPGAEWALEAAPALLGADDAAEDFAPREPGLRALYLRLRGLRFGRAGLVWEFLLRAVIAQKVTSAEAGQSLRDLVYRLGERAPGPHGLWVVPGPDRLAGLGYFHLHPFGLEQRRAETLLRCAREPGLERLVELPAAEALARLQRIRGVGPWTAATTVSASHGDADLVPPGDWNLPHLVAYALAGEPRADDARMFELLEPYRPHRARVVRLLVASGRRAPAFGPRQPLRDLRGI